MADRLTEQQRAAVDSRGRSLLVSAAAGSGKTKVLVERLFSHVVNEGANLDDFLIITYTRAAAAELRGKIARALAERLEEDGGNAHLQRQLLRVYRADIKTVDAFCTALLRENCHLLGEDAQHRALRPDFRVLDEQDEEALKARVLARVLDRFYEGLTPGDGGTLLADTLGAGRDDSALAALVLELHRKLQAQPRRAAWLAQQEERWRTIPERIEDTEYGAVMQDALRRKALHWAALLEGGAAEMGGDAALGAKYAPAFLDAAAQLRALADAAGRAWDEAAARRVDFPRLGAVRGDAGGALRERMKNLWDNCKRAMRKLDATTAVTGAEAIADLRTMTPAMRALLALTEAFTQAYQSEKRRRNAADFSDQEHEAIRLLENADGSPTELARTVAQRYREIMVDEYQDTNEVQNRIFTAISRDGKNLFTVGDVKQSIYRFRLADPTIFLAHYNDYPNEADAAPGESAKLVLSRNFRSRREVLEAANFIFSNILSREMGELDYGAEEALYLGNTGYAENAACRTEFHLVDLPTQSGEHRVRAAEVEARFVAERIAALLRGGFTVQDEQTHLPRPAREEDVVILMRSPRTRLADYRRALEAQGLRCAADADDGFFETMEVAVVFAFLQIIDNPRQDVPLLSVLRSPLFGFTADRLAQLRARTREGEFYDALLADDGEDVHRFLETLNALRLEAQELSVHRLLAAIFDRCGALAVFGAMEGGAERRENLLALLSLAERYEESGYAGLFAFVTHVREMLDSGRLEAPRPARSAGGIRIMSIHKSKGLEFPVVVLADLSRRFGNMDFQSSVLVHPKLGLGPVCVDLTRRIRYPTFAREALERVLRRETKAEELRLLYVAMTRAREKLILVHTQGNAALRVKSLMTTASCPVLPEAVDEGTCLGDWVMLPLLCRGEAAPLRALADVPAGQLVTPGDTPWEVAVHDAAPWLSAERPAAPQAHTAEGREAERPLDVAALAYEYPFADATRLSAKLTATQLKGRAIDDEIAENAALPPRLRSLARPRFVSGSAPLTGAERGTAIHTVMQFLDFFCEGSAEAVRAQIERLRRLRRLTDEQADAADERLIARFLRSDTAERIRRSVHVEREYRFSLLRPARDFAAGAAEDDTVLFQGVADCFFEEDGALVVLDFKTDRITRAETAARAEHYRAQLEAYSDALGRILGKPVKEKLLYFFATDECVKL